MAWLPDGEKNLKISLFVLAQLTNVTDRQTDGHRVTEIAALCIASHSKNWLKQKNVRRLKLIKSKLKQKSLKSFFLKPSVSEHRYHCATQPTG